MRISLLSLVAASAIVSAAAIVPATALTPGSASGIAAAIEETSDLTDVRTVCRHRSGYTGRRCWWVPGGYYHRPYRYHRRHYHRRYR